MLFALAVPAGAFAADVIVHGQVLPSKTVQALEQAYRVPIAPGRFRDRRQRNEALTRSPKV